MSVLESTILFMTMLALAAVPSTNVAVVVTRSVSYGTSNGIFVALGIVMADLVFVILAILGLSAFSEAMGSLFMVFKYLGAAYLIWLGCLMLNSKNTFFESTTSPSKKNNLFMSFFVGFTLTLGDIKAIFFYASLFPMFIDINSIQIFDVFIIAVITIISVGSVKVTYAVLAKKISLSVTDYKYRKAANKIAGGFILGVGSYIIAKA